MPSDGEIAAVPSINDSICRDNRQRFRRLFHWGPIIALFIIFYVAFFALRCSIYLSPPTQSLPGCFQFTFISFMLYRILHSYFNATFLGPGFVPLAWKPSDANAEGKLQFCQNCKGFKPPRSHHCRSCRRCVFKMDHHCPWINTCCGHLNHGHFIWFLLSVPVGCTTSAIVLGRHVYTMWFDLPYLFVRSQFTSLIQIFTEMFLVMFAFGLAVGVTLAVGGLGLYQLYYIQKNQTGIESWIVAKANHWRKEAGLQPFQYPYDLGRWNNLAQVITWSGDAVGDGVKWPLRVGCSEYDLTLEQIHQKQRKKLCVREFRVHRAYNGRYCPCWQMGCRVALDTPYPDEPRLQAEEGAIIHVTRSTRHWLYGQLEPIRRENGYFHGSDSSNDARGWIPRVCVSEVKPAGNTIDLKCNRLKID
ncbi:Palmitoyltransferase zdhhc6 [Clonorchis sinensis]|uniref:Palmitoyltransferase n=1 Tax=Clonorchis sinensis TaxID=79923 RepID=A0A3R7CGL7_CLOSI|nr:Palmitoyltransferase zdhhc6 [Clonorchis sinensis]